jgi:hypothetical protein
VQKQGIEMQPFSHPFAKSVRFRWVPNPNGGVMIQAMVIVPNVPSNPIQSGFDQSKIDQLGDAALKYSEARFLVEIVEF